MNDRTKKIKCIFDDAMEGANSIIFGIALGYLYSHDNHRKDPDKTIFYDRNVEKCERPDDYVCILSTRFYSEPRHGCVMIADYSPLDFIRLCLFMLCDEKLTEEIYVSGKYIIMKTHIIDTSTMFREWYVADTRNMKFYTYRMHDISGRVRGRQRINVRFEEYIISGFVDQFGMVKCPCPIYGCEGAIRVAHGVDVWSTIQNVINVYLVEHIPKINICQLHDIDIITAY